MPLSKLQAGELFVRYQTGLWRCVVEYGFDRYRRQPGKSDHRQGTAASLIHDYMIAGARKVFAEDVESGAVRFIEVKGTDVTLMEIEESVVIWFKKLTGGRQACRNKTGLSGRLFWGECEDIPGIAPAATVVHVGYTPNADQTKVARVSIVRPKRDSKKPEWFFDIERPKDALRVASQQRDDSGEGSKTALRLIISPDQSSLLG